MYHYQLEGFYQIVSRVSSSSTIFNSSSTFTFRNYLHKENASILQTLCQSTSYSMQNPSGIRHLHFKHS